MNRSVSIANSGVRRKSPDVEREPNSAPGMSAWDERRQTRRQLARFLVVGSSSVGIDFAVYSLLAGGLGWPADGAKGLSYLAGVVVGFFGNKWWTFESARRSAGEPIAYLALYAMTLLVNVACNWAVLVVLGPQRTGWAFLFATGVTTVLNFLGMKFVTFRRGIDQRRLEEMQFGAARSERFSRAKTHATKNAK